MGVTKAGVGRQGSGRRLQVSGVRIQASDAKNYQ